MKKLNLKKLRPIPTYLLLILFSLLIVFLTTKIFAKNPKNWLFYTPRPIGSYNEQFINLPYVFTDKHLIINDQDGNIYKIEQNTGKISWNFKVDDYAPFPALKLNDSIIAVNDFNGKIFALDLVSGREIWRFTNPNNTPPDTTLITDDNDEYVFFGDRAGSLFAINKSSGTIAWEKKFRPINLSQINPDQSFVHFGNLSQDENHLYLRSKTEEKIFSIDKKTGEIIWSTNEGEIDYEYQAVIATPEVNLVNSSEFTYALEKGTGRIIWKMMSDIKPNQKNVRDSHLYFSRTPQQLVKVELTTGKIIWEININEEIKPNLKLAENNGYLQQHFVGSQSKIINFDLENSLVHWSTRIPLDITTQLTSHDESLIFGTNKGQLFIIDEQSGQVTKDLFVGGEISKIIKNTEDATDFTVLSTSNNSRLLLSKLDQNFDPIWKFETHYRIDPKSIHFHEENNQIFFTDEGHQLLSAIKLDNQSSFKQNDFSLETIANQNNDSLIEMEKFFSDLLPDFLEKQKKQLELPQKLSNNLKMISESINSWWYHFRQIRPKLFSVKSKYDQSIIDITIKHSLENKGQSLSNLVQPTATLTSPTGKKYSVAGFSYQKNIWKIRFRPDEKGVWTYRAKLKTPIGIQNPTFTEKIEIEEISKIQYLKLDQNNPQTFLLENGSQFYPLGIEDIMKDLSQDNNPLNQWALAETLTPPEELADIKFVNFDQYLDLYAQSGFNFFRWGVGNISFTLWRELDGYRKIDYSVGKYGDQLAHTLRQKDYHLMMTIFDFHPPFPFSIDDSEHQELLKKYLDYVVARYGSYVDIWEITNEAEVDPNWLEFVINYLEKIDPYQHPISTNWDRPKMRSLDLLSLHWYQSEPVPQTALTIKNMADFYKQFDKPILFSETGNIDASWDPESADRLRTRLWTGFFNQTYFVFWNHPRTIFYNPNNANVYLGPQERSFVKIFVDLIKGFPQFLEPFSLKNDHPNLEIFGLKNETQAYLYLTKNEPTQDDLEISLPFFAKKITWLDPKTGQVIQKKSSLNDNQLQLPPFNIDLVAKIEF